MLLEWCLFIYLNKYSVAGAGGGRGTCLGKSEKDLRSLGAGVTDNSESN